MRVINQNYGQERQLGQKDEIYLKWEVTEVKRLQ